MQEITLTEILQCRENRAYKQRSLLQAYGSSVLCFTMNIAGPIKTSPLIERAFSVGLELLEQQIPDDSILHRETKTAPTGCEAFFAVNMDAADLKEICIRIEESMPLGRLFDMDVLAADGIKLGRNGQRGCIVCGAPGRGCAASRRHSVTQLQAATIEILCSHFAEADSCKIASLAVQSLIEEVSATPKPGLVDRRNTGSHHDMTLDSFLASAHALEPYFRECVRIGQKCASRTPKDTFSELRTAGIAAENTMYRATQGVNTHKGAIYSMGILCGALGCLWTADKEAISLSDLQAQCSALTTHAVQNDFSRMNGTTAGERLYQKYGITGIRGEASEGFPSAVNIGLPAFQESLRKGFSAELAGTHALIHLIANVADTNLYHRGGPEGAAWAAREAQTLLRISAFPASDKLETLDDAFILRNLSPGGCADLLAVVFFLHHLQTEKHLTF